MNLNTPTALVIVFLGIPALCIVVFVTLVQLGILS